jgi:hypothetical protein
MTTTASWMMWTPRVLGLAVAVFLGLFALDAFRPGQPLSEGLIGFAIHLLPSLLVAAAVALAWRWPWLGGLLFVLFAVAYAVSVPQRVDWILVIAGPLLLVGLLFIVSWRFQATA